MAQGSFSSPNTYTKELNGFSSFKQMLNGRSSKSSGLNIPSKKFYPGSFRVAHSRRPSLGTLEPLCVGKRCASTALKTGDNNKSISKVNGLFSTIS
jgi:hypothetical protein